MSEQPTTRKKPDIDDREVEWPNELPTSLRQRLEGLAKTIAQAKSLSDTLLPSDMKKDARRISKAASKLLNMVRDFSRDYGIAVYENYRTAACDSLKEGLDGLDPDAEDNFRVGMCTSSLQYPLIGLVAYMHELESIPSKAGPRGVHLERYAVRKTIEEFSRHEFECSESMLFATCKAVLANAGIEKRDDAIGHYLRGLAPAKT